MSYTKELTIGQDVVYLHKIWTVRAKMKNTTTGEIHYTVERGHSTKTLIQEPGIGIFERYMEYSYD